VARRWVLAVKLGGKGQELSKRYPVDDSDASLLGNFERDRSVCLLLHHHGSWRYARTMGYIPYLSIDEVAALNLLSMIKLKRAISLVFFASCSCTRMAQISRRRRGAFCPTSLLYSKVQRRFQSLRTHFSLTRHAWTSSLNSKSIRRLRA